MKCVEFVGGPLDGEIGEMPITPDEFIIPRRADGSPLGTPAGFVFPAVLGDTEGVYRYSRGGDYIWMGERWRKLM